MARAHGFGEAQRHGKENRIARRNIGHRNFNTRKVAILWNGNVGGERASTKRAQINRDLAVLVGAKSARNTLGKFQFHSVALAVINGKRGACETIRVQGRKRDRAIKTAGKQDNCLAIVGFFICGTSHTKISITFNLMPTLATHVRCDRCKYDLHGCGLFNVCPECGLAVATTLAGHSDLQIRALVALQRPARVATFLVAIPLACMLCAVLQSAGPMIAFFDSMSGKSTKIAEQIRVFGWRASCVLMALALVIACMGLLASEFSLRAEMRKWRVWLNGGLLLWVATLIVIIVSAIKLQSQEWVMDWLKMSAPALQLPAFAMVLISYRRLLLVCGRRSQAFREAGSARQNINLLIYTLGLVALGAFASPILLHKLGWEVAAMVSDSLVAVESAVLIFGLAYLVANAWWIARSLLLPPMKFEM